MKIRASLSRREHLTSETRCQLYALLCRHFSGVDVDQFEADLMAKNWVIQLWDEADVLVGFSTLKVFEASHDGEPCTVVYSGDTIVDPRAWHSWTLSRAWIHAVLDICRPFGGRPIWWLLIASGFRTYRFLPVFWREFYPRYDGATPASIAAFKQQLACELFGGQYDPDAHIVRFSRPQQLRGHLQGIDANRLKDPHVAYFHTANPGHEHGDELVCITRIDATNLTRAGQRMVSASPTTVGATR